MPLKPTAPNAQQRERLPIGFKFRQRSAIVAWVIVLSAMSRGRRWTALLALCTPLLGSSMSLMPLQWQETLLASNAFMTQSTSYIRVCEQLTTSFAWTAKFCAGGSSSSSADQGHEAKDGGPGGQTREGELVIDGKRIKSSIYFIRHGEKPKDGAKRLSVLGKKRAQCLRDVFGRRGGGHKGKHRSKNRGFYDVGYILTQNYDPVDGSRSRPYDTVKPLAKDLGLRIDHHCDRDDTACVLRAIRDFDDEQDREIALRSDEEVDPEADDDKAGFFASLDRGDGDSRILRKAQSKTTAMRRKRKGILVCWEHKRLKNISGALGEKFIYPSRRYDLVFEMVRGRVTQRSPFSERCEGLEE